MPVPKAEPSPVVLLTDYQWEAVTLLADILAYLRPEDRRVAMEVALADAGES